MLDQGGLAGGVTSGAFGWLNTSNGPTPAAQLARHDGLALWRQRPFCDHVTWCGAVREAQVAGAHLFEGQTGLSVAGPFWISDQDGMVDPSRVVQALLDAPGITVCTDVAVTKVAAHWAETDAGRVMAQAVVVAAGLGSLTLLPDLPLWPGPAVLAEFGPCPPLLRHIVQGWGVELRQRSDGNLVGVFGLDMSPRKVQSLAQSALGCDLPLPVLTRWLRPMTKEGMPIAARQPSGVYAAVGHPGVILAPLIGHQVAAAIGPPSVHS